MSASPSRQRGWRRASFSRTLLPLWDFPGAWMDSVGRPCTKREGLKQSSASNIQTELCACMGGGGGRGRSSDGLTQLSHTAHQDCGREVADLQEKGTIWKCF